jgi:hypothetical protein
MFSYSSALLIVTQVREPLDMQRSYSRKKSAVKVGDVHGLTGLPSCTCWPEKGLRLGGEHGQARWSDVEAEALPAVGWPSTPGKGEVVSRGGQSYFKK